MHTRMVNIQDTNSCDTRNLASMTGTSIKMVDETMDRMFYIGILQRQALYTKGLSNETSSCDTRNLAAMTGISVKMVDQTMDRMFCIGILQRQALTQSTMLL